ncbi:MAG: carboxymuconolactone decarboxylase family protein [Alphaproteobacteria bacterium]
MAKKLPPLPASIARQHPDIWHAYDKLGAAAAAAGPLAARERRLVKLALAIGAGSEGAVHSHVRRGLAEGVPAEAMRQTALLAITTLGFPQAAAALSWIDDVVAPRSKKPKRKTSR